MEKQEKRYQVTKQLTGVYQIVVQAYSPEDAEYVSDAINMEKWRYIEGFSEVLDVAPDYFLKPVNN